MARQKGILETDCGNRTEASHGATADNINEDECLLEKSGGLHRHKYCPDLNREYLPSKVFFFLYFAANGTLMPYLVLYFKQLRLNPSQVGIVSGAKPFIAFVFVPIWGLIADKTKRAKLIYVLSMIFYACGYFAYSLAPAKYVCLVRSNSSKHTIIYPMSMHSHGRRALTKHSHSGSRNSSAAKETTPDGQALIKRIFTTHINNSSQPHRRTWSSDKISRYLPRSLSADAVYDHPWTFSASAKMSLLDEVAFQDMSEVHVDISAIFSYLVVVTVVSTVVSCPALTFVDTATIRKLKQREATHLYGKQRLWGSLGWGLFAFGVGAALSLLPLCPGINNEVNYNPMFYVFALLLLCALGAGLKLTFVDESGPDPSLTDRQVQDNQHRWIVLAMLRKPKYIAFVLTTFFTGVVMSVIRTFLFWHLKDLGGSQILFSIIPAVNCAAEVFMYYFSSSFIQKVGHIRVLYAALLCYAIRLFYYGLLSNPWFALAVEPFSGITTAAAWAAMTSYVGVNAPPEVATTMQDSFWGDFPPFFGNSSSQVHHQCIDYLRASEKASVADGCNVAPFNDL